MTREEQRPCDLSGEGLGRYMREAQADHVARHGELEPFEAAARVRAIRDGGSLEPKDIKARARRMARRAR